MAIITNQANLTYTYGATTASVRSNVAATELAAALDAEKRALDGSYRDASTLTYVISLRNESETTIPALPAVTGPYYLWEDLRTYLLSRIASR